MQHKNSRSLVDYWSQIRGDRIAPRRGDIHLQHLPKGIIPHFFMLDARDIWRPAYRFAGQQLCAHFSLPTGAALEASMRDKDFLRPWGPECRNLVAHYMKSSLSGLAQPVKLAYIGMNDDTSTAEFETILAPIAYEGEKPSGFVGTTTMLSRSRRSTAPYGGFRLTANSPQIVDDENSEVYDIPPVRRVGPAVDRPPARLLKLVATQ